MSKDNFQYGDIIMLVDPLPQDFDNQHRDPIGSVTVAIQKDCDYWGTALYSAGKLAVFLHEEKQEDIVLSESDDFVYCQPSKCYIFIDGSMGWVYKDEIQKFISI